VVARSGRWRRKANAALSLVVVFVLLALLAIAVGYLGGNYLLGSIGGGRRQQEAGEEPGGASPGSPGSTDPPPVTEGTGVGSVDLNFPSLEFYKVQAGAFNEREKASSLVQELHALDLPACAWEGEDYHRVLVGLTGGEESARELADKVEAAGFQDCFSASLAFPARAHEVAVHSEDMASLLSEAVAGVSDLVAAEASYWGGGYTVRTDDLEAVFSVADKLSEVHDRISSMSPEDEDAGVHLILLRFMSDVVMSHIETLEALGSGAVPAQEPMSSFVKLVVSLQELSDELAPYAAP